MAPRSKALTLVLPLVLAGAAALPAAANDRVLVVLAKQFNSGEFWTPYLVLTAAGYRVDVAGPAAGRIPMRGDEEPSERDATATLALADVRPDDYAGLVIPGGYSPANLEKLPKALDICRAFMKAGKPVAGICHGPRLLMRADLLRDRVCTCLASVANELADAWKAGAYGTWVDEPVVVDGTLVTSRYPGDLTPFCRTLLAKLEAAGGLKPLRGPIPTVVIAPGVGGHDKWTLTEIPGILGLSVAFVGSAADVEALIAEEGFRPDAFPVVAVFDTKGYEALAESQAVKDLLAGVAKAGGVVVPVGDARRVTSAAGVPASALMPATGSPQDALPALYAAAARAAETFTVPPEPAPAFTAALVLKEGFDGAAAAAAEAFLAMHGQRVLTVGPKAGWVLGAEGLPRHVDATELGMKGTSVEVAEGVTVILAKQPDLGEGLKAFAAGAGAPVPEAGLYTAALCLRRGFDAKVAAAMKAWLVSQGRKVVVVGHETGDLESLNGRAMSVGAVYGKVEGLAKDALLVLPGGVWPEKAAARQADQPAWIDEQAARDQARHAWTMRQWERGATVLAVGFDSLRLGRGHAVFKGKKFAASSQSVWSFGKAGGRYGGDDAIQTAERLVTTKGFETLPAAVKLLTGE